jgi:hypothetical protein
MTSQCLSIPIFQKKLSSDKKSIILYSKEPLANPTGIRAVAAKGSDVNKDFT